MKWSIFASLLVLVLSVQTAYGERLYLDSALAIVEDDVITNYELSREVERIREDLQQQGRRLPEDVQLNRQVLELMIVKSIMLQQAKNRGVIITDTQLNTTLQKMAQSNQLSLEQFRRQLVNSGIDYADFREDIRDELAINQIKAGYARQNAEVSDQEVDEFISRTSTLEASLQYRLNHILIALPDGASSEQVRTARENIEQVRQRVTQGADFAAQASQFSDGSNALQGGDLGWRSLAETPSLFADLLPTMQVGETSEVLRSASGFHIVQLAERRDGDRLIVEQTRARHILIKPDQLTNAEQARQQLVNIRQRILAGEDFAALAKLYSNDPGSGGLGGDLGWFGKGVMVDEFQQVVDNTAINEISPVFRSPFGWHVLQVMERRQVDETEENKREKIRQQLLEQKRVEVLELWQRRLRDQAFVKIIDA